MKKVIWLIYREEDAVYNKSYIDCYVQEASNLNVELKVMYADYLTIELRNDKFVIHYQGILVEHPDCAIVRIIYPFLSEYLERANIKVFNNSEVARICNDKALTYLYLSGKNIPMIPTQFSKNEFYCNFPYEESKVTKAISGHGGSQVYLNSTQSKLDTWNGLDGQDAVIQPLFGAVYKDLRVYVIGNNIICAILRRSEERRVGKEC